MTVDGRPSRSPLRRSLPVTLALGAVLIAAAALAVMNWPVITANIQLMQQSFHRQLAVAIRLAGQEEGAAFWSLIVLSFGYGVFHAAGPGHGKMVIATYLASRPTKLARGLAISVLSSLTQGVTAVSAVGVGAWLLGWSARDINAASGNLEIASYGLVSAMGLGLVVLAVARMRRRATRSEVGPAGGCHHDHGVHNQSPDSAWQAIVMIFSIGIRPCSGAVLVLIFAFALNMVWGGVFAVLAMSAGTAMTVAALAVLTVGARSTATRLSHAMAINERVLMRIGDIAAVSGGLIIFLLGASLISAALSVQSHPLL